MKIDDFKNLLQSYLPSGFVVDGVAENPLHVVIKNEDETKGVWIDVSEVIAKVKKATVENIARECLLVIMRTTNKGICRMGI